MIEVVQAFDRERIAELPTDDASALETKLTTARARFQDCAAWLHPHERMAVLHKLAGLFEKQRETFATLIAREGGKPYSDALVETDRAIDGIRNAADLSAHAGRRRDSHGPHPRKREPPRLDRKGADRRGGGDLRLQPSAQPHRAPSRT